jgi:curved DNA-binding protein CbpA
LDIERAKSPYEILNVGADVSREDLRKAYLDKIKTYHPDCSDQFLKQYNQEMLKIINSAYERLKGTSSCQPTDI